MNVDKLRLVQQRIRELPAEQFNMSQFLVRDTSCGTVGCIAGWTCQMFNPLPISETYMETAMNILELKDMKLFFTIEWDEPYRKEYYFRNVFNPEARKQIALDYIDYYIAKYGEQPISDSVINDLNKVIPLEKINFKKEYV